MSKFNSGDQVRIIESPELHELGIPGMIGREAMVLDPVFSKSTGRETGSWVRMLGGDFDGESEWFIPVMSLHRLRANKPRSESPVEAEAEGFEYIAGDGVAHVIA